MFQTITYNICTVDCKTSPTCLLC